MNALIRRINKNQITKAIPNCLECGLPEHVCICEEIQHLRQNTLKIHLHVILHEKELGRNTNTGRLVEFIFADHVHYYLWERKSPPAGLMNIIESDKEAVYLLYPANEDSDFIRPEAVMKRYEKDLKNIHLIILDGTWQEARKIQNKSPYLKTVTRLELDVQEQSVFTLRRNQKQGNLCTAEAVYHALFQLEDHNSAQNLQEVTSLFLRRYEIGRGGHGL